MSDYETEVIYRIFDNGAGHFIHIGPSPDFPGNIILMNENSKDGEEYFGKIRLDMSAEFMRQLGSALIKAADQEQKG